MSRCGSTLVSQMLATPAANLVVSEAEPIDAVVRARQARPDLSEDEHALWLTWIIGALGQPRGGERHYFIKLDSWHTLALPLFRRAFPDVPWIFLYRDPVEVIVSQTDHARPANDPGTLDIGLLGLNADRIRRAARTTARECWPPSASRCSIARQTTRSCWSTTGSAAGGMERDPPHFGIDISADDRAVMQRRQNTTPRCQRLRSLPTSTQTAQGHRGHSVAAERAAR